MTVQMLLILLTVLGAILWLGLQLNGRLRATLRRSGGQFIEITEARRLEAGKTLYAIRFEGRALLVGASAQGLHLLSSSPQGDVRGENSNKLGWRGVAANSATADGSEDQESAVSNCTM